MFFSLETICKICAQLVYTSHKMAPIHPYLSFFVPRNDWLFKGLKPIAIYPHYFNLPIPQSVIFMKKPFKFKKLWASLKP